MTEFGGNMPRHDGMKTTLLERLASETCDEHSLRIDRTDSCRIRAIRNISMLLCYDDNGCSN